MIDSLIFPELRKRGRLQARPITRARLPAWIYPLIACLLLVVSIGSAPADSWTGTLRDGSVLKVDPDSRRAMRHYNGDVSPLWDGTHRLEDGSVVIVRDGQAIPTESMMNSWMGEPGSEPSMRTRYCDQLVRKVCGFHDECRRDQSCILARQLLGMEREQQRQTPVGAGPWPHTPSGGECRDALSNPAFPPCGSSTPGSEQTACGKLTDKVCGDANQCETARACNPARQLLQMEADERLRSADPEALTPTGAECEKAMNNAFFEPCR